MTRAKKMPEIMISGEDGGITTPKGDTTAVAFPCKMRIAFQRETTVVHTPQEVAQAIYDLDTMYFDSVAEALDYVDLVCRGTTDPAHFRETGTSKDQGDLMAIYQ